MASVTCYVALPFVRNEDVGLITCRAASEDHLLRQLRASFAI